MGECDSWARSRVTAVLRQLYGRLGQTTSSEISQHKMFLQLGRDCAVLSECEILENQGAPGDLTWAGVNLVTHLVPLCLGAKLAIFRASWTRGCWRWRVLDSPEPLGFLKCPTCAHFRPRWPLGLRWVKGGGVWSLGMVDATLGQIGDICFVLGAITDRVCESNDD